MCLKKINKRIEKLDVLDIGLIKLAVASIVIFIISVWDEFMSWIEMMNPWYFLLVGFVAVIRPTYKLYMKK